MVQSIIRLMEIEKVLQSELLAFRYDKHIDFIVIIKDECTNPGISCRSTENEGEHLISEFVLCFATESFENNWFTVYDAW